jgi:acyl-coenzyme A thioesterase PaaI-like protein
VNFLASAKPGPLVAEAKVIQLGKTIAFMDGKLHGRGRHADCHGHHNRAAARSGAGCAGAKSAT